MKDLNTYIIAWGDVNGFRIGPEYKEKIIAKTPGKAKYMFFITYLEHLNFRDFLRGVVVTRIGKTKLSDYFSCSEEFYKVKMKRGIEFAELGMKVEVCGKIGSIVGANYSQNLDIYLEKENYITNCHPHYDIKYYDKNNKIIKEYGKC